MSGWPGQSLVVVAGDRSYQAAGGAAPTPRISHVASPSRWRRRRVTGGRPGGARSC